MPGSFDLLDPQRAPRGVATLLKTPFKSENRLDEESYRRQVRHVIDAGTVLLIPGMVGSETFCLPPEDRERCIEISLEESDGRVPVCAAVGGIGIYDVANAAVKAQEMGADMIAVIPPPWIAGERDGAACLEQVARSVELTVMIHSAFGAPASKIFSAETIDRLVREVPNIRYVKVEGPRWVQQATDIKEKSGDRLVRLMSAPNFGEVYRAGCRLLMIAAHIIEPLVALFDALEADDDASAGRIEADIAPFGGIHLTGVRRDPHQCSAADRHGRFAPGRSRLVGCPRRLGGSGGSFLGRRLAMRSWKRIGSWATASSSPR